jgi:hypothetical protein
LARNELVGLASLKTLILPARYTSDSILLSEEAVEARWQVERLQVWRPPLSLRETVAAIYGEPLFGAVIAQELSLVLLEPTLGWLAEIPRRYLLRDVTFTTLDEGKRLRRPAFVKPADDKCFPAGVYQDGAGLRVSDLLSSTTPVLISDPVVWDIEVRFFILNKRISTFSIYSQLGTLVPEGEARLWTKEPEAIEAIEFCNRLITDSAVSLPPSVAIDIGRIDNSGWAVIEANAAWASGIYGCEPRKVLDVIERACVKRENVTGADKVWVRENGLN